MARGSETPSGSVEVAALELPRQEVLMNLVRLLVYNLAVPDIVKLRSRFVRRIARKVLKIIKEEVRTARRKHALEIQKNGG